MLFLTHGPNQTMLNTPINRLERFSLCAHAWFSQNIIIFSIDYLKDENCLPPPKKSGNFQLFDIHPSLVIDNWKSLITRKIMTLRKGFCNIPGQNGDLSKLTSCQTTLSGWRGGQKLCTHLYIATFFLFYLAI